MIAATREPFTVTLKAHAWFLGEVFDPHRTSLRIGLLLLRRQLRIHSGYQSGWQAVEDTRDIAPAFTFQLTRKPTMNSITTEIYILSFVHRLFLRLTDKIAEALSCWRRNCVAGMEHKDEGLWGKQVAL